MYSIKLSLSFKILFLATYLVVGVNLATAQTGDLVELRAVFAPLPKQADSISNPITAEKVALGKRLYNDKILSISKDLSCASCHNLTTYGVDNKPTSDGHKGQKGNRNSPTVYNAALHSTQFWDGRAIDVEEQALGPVLNPLEMSMPSENEVVTRLKAAPDYARMFEVAFPGESEPITFKNMGRAIGAFERMLITPSKFDKFLVGDDKALNENEIRGLRTFRDVGCVACHSGATLGGQMFQKLGLVKPYETKDLGRYEVTKKEVDKFIFKVPSLRNIDKTAPYFHDGSIKTLEEAIKLMAYHQLARTLSDQEVSDIVVFLKTLSGSIPEITK